MESLHLWRDVFRCRTVQGDPKQHALVAAVRGGRGAAARLELRVPVLTDDRVADAAYAAARKDHEMVRLAARSMDSPPPAPDAFADLWRALDRWLIARLAAWSVLESMARPYFLEHKETNLVERRRLEMAISDRVQTTGADYRYLGYSDYDRDDGRPLEAKKRSLRRAGEQADPKQPPKRDTNAAPASGVKLFLGGGGWKDLRKLFLDSGRSADAQELDRSVPKYAHLEAPSVTDLGDSPALVLLYEEWLLRRDGYVADGDYSSAGGGGGGGGRSASNDSKVGDATVAEQLATLVVSVRADIDWYLGLGNEMRDRTERWSPARSYSDIVRAAEAAERAVLEGYLRRVDRRYAARFGDLCDRLLELLKQAVADFVEEYYESVEYDVDKKRLRPLDKLSRALLGHEEAHVGKLVKDARAEVADRIDLWRQEVGRPTQAEVDAVWDADRRGEALLIDPTKARERFDALAAAVYARRGLSARALSRLLSRPPDASLLPGALTTDPDRSEPRKAELRRASLQLRNWMLGELRGGDPVRRGWIIDSFDRLWAEHLADAPGGYEPEWLEPMTDGERKVRERPRHFQRPAKNDRGDAIRRKAEESLRKLATEWNQRLGHSLDVRIGAIIDRISDEIFGPDENDDTQPTDPKKLRTEAIAASPPPAAPDIPMADALTKDNKRTREAGS